MKHLAEYVFETILLEKLNLKDIPTDSALEKPEMYDGEPPYKNYRYFGDCKNTVDKDHMWDATEMANWINNNCKVTEVTNVLDKIQDGDRKIPKKVLNIIDKLKTENKLNDTSEIVCALDDHQRIMFIYLTVTDTHYFFDCKK